MPARHRTAHMIRSTSANFKPNQCWGVDSINAPDLQEIKTHRLSKESGQLDSLSIAENGRCGFKCHVRSCDTIALDRTILCTALQDRGLTPADVLNVANQKTNDERFFS